MHVHLDPLGGMAGDMFVAAALSAWPEWQPALFEALGRCRLPDGFVPQVGERRSHAIAGLRFTLAQPDHPTPPPSGAFRDIRAQLSASALDGGVKSRAIAIFTLLAEAEAAVHAVNVDDVHFHELADWDSIADIVAAAWLIARIDAGSWSVGPLPLGSGTVATAHGRLPLPAPATARLLQGFEVIDDGIDGERVTPTGAAILRHLAPAPRRGMAGRMLRTGHGIGTRTLPDRPNVLRLLALEREFGADDRVAVLSLDIDDQSAEDLAVAADHLRALPGVIDLTQVAAVGKKGRFVQRLQILCAPDALHAVSERCFAETTTIGMRWHVEERRVLARSLAEHEGVRVKRVERPGARVTAKAEIDDVRDLPSHAERSRARARAERATTGEETP